MHVGFNSYVKIATFLEPIEQKIDLLKYAFFTRTKEGSCLRGTAFPKVHRLISMLYSELVLILSCLPSYCLFRQLCPNALQAQS